MANKGIFIGLGGSGVKTLAHLKAKLRQAAANRQEFEESCRFIFVDTDEKDTRRMNNLYRAQFDDDLIDATERIELGRVNPLASYLNAKSNVEKGNGNSIEKRLVEVIDARGTATLKNERLVEGASANRQQGRIAVSRESDTISVAVGNAIRYLSNLSRDASDSHRILIYLVTGTCGGTGSSSFLDIAYLIDRQYKLMRQDGDPKIRAVLFMPNWFIERYQQDNAASGVIENFRLNSHAFSDELDFFLRDHYHNRNLAGSGEKFSAVCIDPTVDNGIVEANKKWKVFSYGICIDSTTENGASLTDEQMYKNTAEMLFYLYQGDTERAIVSALDNETYENCANAADSSTVPAFATMGYRALQFPENLLSDYFSKRFLYELFSFGLLGKSYREALPDDAERQADRAEIFRQCVRRYLFAEDKEADIPNLEENAGRIVTKFLNSLNTQSFEKTERGMLKRMLGGSDEIEFDEKKICDAGEISRFLAQGEAVSERARREIRQDFQNRESKTGRETLLRLVQRGAESATTTAQTGSLDRMFEDSILSFGLRYTAEVARMLDDLAEAKRSETDVEKQKKNERLSQLDAEIISIQAECLSDETKRSDRTNALIALEQRLKEKIRVEADIEILNSQIRVLNDLSEGESGILDQYKRNLFALERSVVNKLIGDASSNTNNNLRDDFLKHLPSRFIETEKDVTTTYLPDVSSFVQNDEWTSDNLFSTLYRTVIEHRSIPGGGSEPVRHGEKIDHHRNIAGLHKVMRDILADKEIVGGQQGFERSGELVYFRQFFTLDSTDTPEKMVNQMIEFAEKFITAKVRQSETVQGEINKSLLERLRSTSDAEKQRVKEKFSNRGTQTFCRMNDPIQYQPAVRALYVGNDTLAKELGHDETRTELIKADAQNRFLKIKISSGHLLSAYPHHPSLAEIYQTVREQRRHTNKPFVPHIHRAFNDHGVAEAMSLLTQHLDESVWHWFVAALIYREIFEAAEEMRGDLLGEIFYHDPRQTGTHETCRTPFTVEEIPNTNDFRIMACTDIKQKNQKLWLEKGAFENVKAGQLNHRDMFDGLMSKPPVRRTIEEIDRFFREHCSNDWLEVFDRAEATLQEKLRDFRAEVNDSDLQTFYDKTIRESTLFSDELREHIASRRQGAAQKPDETAPAKRLRL